MTQAAPQFGPSGQDGPMSATLAPAPPAEATAPPTSTEPTAPGGLTPDEVELLGHELDAIRQSVLDDRGERDAAYIRRLITVQRGLELGGRLTLLVSRGRPTWVLGTTALALAKILDNMEIGHNVL